MKEAGVLLASASARSVAGRVAHSRINEAGSYLQPTIKYGSNSVYVVVKYQTKVAASSVSVSARPAVGWVAHGGVNEVGSYLQPMIKYGSNGVYVVGKCQTEKVAVSSALVSARPAAGWVACSRHAAGSMKRHHTCNLRSNM